MLDRSQFHPPAAEPPEEDTSICLRIIRGRRRDGFRWHLDRRCRQPQRESPPPTPEDNPFRVRRRHEAQVRSSQGLHAPLQRAHAWTHPEGTFGIRPGVRLYQETESEGRWGAGTDGEGPGLIHLPTEAAKRVVAMPCLVRSVFDCPNALL